MAKLHSLAVEFRARRKKLAKTKRFVTSALLSLVAVLTFIGTVSPAFAAYLDQMIGTYTPTSRTPDQWDNTHLFMPKDGDGVSVSLTTYQTRLNLTEQEGSAVYNGSIELIPRNALGVYFNALSDFKGESMKVIIDVSGFADDASEYEIADSLDGGGSPIDSSNYTLERDGSIVTITFPKGFYLPELVDILSRMSLDDLNAMNQATMQLNEQWQVDYPDGDIPEEVMRLGTIAILAQYMSAYVDDPQTYDWGQVYDDMVSGASVFGLALLDFSFRLPYIDNDHSAYLGDGILKGTVTICQDADSECAPQSYADCDELATSSVRCVRIAEYGYPQPDSYGPDGWSGVRPSATLYSSLMMRYSAANPVRFPAGALEATDPEAALIMNQNDIVLLGFHPSRLTEGQEASYDVNLTTLLDDFDIDSQFYTRYNTSIGQSSVADPPDPSYGTVEIVDGHVKVWTKKTANSEDIVLGLKLKPKATPGDGIVRIVQRTCAAWPGETASTDDCVAPDSSPNPYDYGLTTGETIYTLSRYKVGQSYEVLGGGPVVPGATVRFTTTVQNLGDTPATGAVNIDLRRLLDYVDWLDDVDVNYPQGAGVGGRWWGNLARSRLDSYFHQLAPHESSTMTFTVKIKESTPVGTNLDTLAWYCNPYTGCDSDPDVCSILFDEVGIEEPYTVGCTGGMYAYWVEAFNISQQEEISEENAQTMAFIDRVVQSGTPTSCRDDNNACSQARLTVQAVGDPGEDGLLDKALAVEDKPVNLDSSRQPTLTVTNRPYFSGKTEKPFSPVTVTVRSDPVSCSASSDAQGNWSCTLPTTIPSGSHTALVYVTDPDTNAVTTFGPYNLTVAGSGATTITNMTLLGAPDTGMGLALDTAKIIVFVAAIFAVPTILAVRYRLRASSRL